MQENTTRWWSRGFVPVIGLCVAAPLWAAKDQPTAQPRTGASAAEKQSYQGLRATQMIGKHVRNSQGQTLGEIDDLIIDMNTGKLRYAILRFDPGIFSGERLFAVPPSELRMSRNKDEVLYNMARERLEKAGVEKKRWPGVLRERNYLAGLDRTYGVVQPSSDRRAFSARELIGKDVNDRTGDEIGEIRELVINLNEQTVHYAVLNFDPSWTAPEKLFAFPLRAFGFTDDKDELVLNVDRTTLRAMRSFDHQLWSAMSDVSFVSDMDRHLVTINPAVGGTR